MAISDLNNFYKEFSYGSDKFETQMQIYTELFDLLYDMIDQTADNLVIPNIGIYSYMPIQLIQAGDAIYDVGEILIDAKIVSGYNLSGLTLGERIAYWNDTMPINDKVAILDTKKKYIYFSTTRDGNLDQRNYPVIDFNLQTIKGRNLIKNVDYAFHDNKVYLLRNISEYYKDDGKLIATNIAIDYNAVENLIGKKVYTPYKEVLTKNEYRDIVQTLLYVGLGGPTLRNLNITLNTLVGAGQFKIVDRRSASGYYKSFWDEKIRGDKALNRFDFLIMSPPDVITNTNTISIITNYLKLIKLSYTDFYLSPYIELTERYHLDKLFEEVIHQLIVAKKDILKASDKQSFFGKALFTDHISYAENMSFAQLKNFYDLVTVAGNTEYQLNIVKKDIIKALEKQSFFGKTSFTDHISYAENMLFAQLTRFSDSIIALSTKKFFIKHNVLSTDGNFDRIKANEINKYILDSSTVDKKQNIGSLIFYDIGVSYDDEANDIWYDMNENIEITDESYYDTVAIKLIPKSEL